VERLGPCRLRRRTRRPKLKQAVHVEEVEATALTALSRMFIIPLQAPFINGMQSINPLF